MRFSVTPLAAMFGLRLQLISLVKAPLPAALVHAVLEVQVTLAVVALLLLSCRAVRLPLLAVPMAPVVLTVQ